jgi:hypothetical protein
MKLYVEKVLLPYLSAKKIALGLLPSSSASFAWIGKSTSH